MSINSMISNNLEESIELTPRQKANLRYYNKMKADPIFQEKQRVASTKYYNKIKDNEDFKKQVSEQKKMYNKKMKEINIDYLFPNSCL